MNKRKSIGREKTLKHAGIKRAAIILLMLSTIVIAFAATAISTREPQATTLGENQKPKTARAPPPQTAWNKTYGGTDYEVAYSVQQTSDSGYIMTGNKDSSGATGWDSWLVKTDGNGNQQWNKTIGGTGFDAAYEVKQTSDGGYIIAGYTSSFGAAGVNFWLVKTDGNGNVQWNKTYGHYGLDYAFSVQQTSDGGYITAGSTAIYTPWGGGMPDVWVVKTDGNGVQQWNKTYGGTGSDAAGSIRRTSDGGYIAAGYTNSSGAGSYDFWLVKTDSNGIQQWNKTYGGTGADGAKSVQQTSDGGYIMTGYTKSFGAGESDFWLVKTDSNGIQQWNKTYGGTADDKAESVRQTSDGGYITAGYTWSFGAGDRDFWLIKIRDPTPPSAIADLVAGSPTSSSITLNWTAPGDDGNAGNATGYVVKYSTTGSLTEANWSSAATYTQSWTPLLAGGQETRVVSGLNSSTRYWFAIKAYDEVPNYGACSNSPNAITTGGAAGLPVEIIAIVAIAAVAVVGVVVLLVRLRKSKSHSAG